MFVFSFFLSSPSFPSFSLILSPSLPSSLPFLSHSVFICFALCFLIHSLHSLHSLLSTPSFALSLFLSLLSLYFFLSLSHSSFFSPTTSSWLSLLLSHPPTPEPHTFPLCSPHTMRPLPVAVVLRIDVL